MFSLSAKQPVANIGPHSLVKGVLIEDGVVSLHVPRRPPKVLHLWPPKLLHPGRGDLTH